jgi:hypothetical protein
MQHAVIVHLRLGGAGFGSPDQRKALYALEDQLEQALISGTVGEYDGNEVGQGEFVLYMYGQDANALFAAVEPFLKACPAAAGGYAIKRYGDASDPTAREVRVNW